MRVSLIFFCFNISRKKKKKLLLNTALLTSSSRSIGRYLTYSTKSQTKINIFPFFLSFVFPPFFSLNHCFVISSYFDRKRRYPSFYAERIRTIDANESKLPRTNSIEAFPGTSDASNLRSIARHVLVDFSFLFSFFFFLSFLFLSNYTESRQLRAHREKTESYGVRHYYLGYQLGTIIIIIIIVIFIMIIVTAAITLVSRGLANLIVFLVSLFSEEPGLLQLILEGVHTLFVRQAAILENLAGSLIIVTEEEIRINIHCERESFLFFSFFFF